MLPSGAGGEENITRSGYGLNIYHAKTYINPNEC